MDYVALKNELINDPLALGYAPYVAANDDETLASMLNVKNVTSSQEVSVSKTFVYLLRKQKWETLENAAGNTASPAHSSAYGLYKLASREDLSWDWMSTEGQSFLSNLVTNSILTAQQRTDLENICKITISRAQSLFGSDVSPGDISIALRNT